MLSAAAVCVVQLLLPSVPCRPAVGGRCSCGAGVQVARVLPLLCNKHMCACLSGCLQLSFRALFTIAANCPLLEVRRKWGREAVAAVQASTTVADLLQEPGSVGLAGWLGRRAVAMLAEPCGCLLPGIPLRLQDVCISEEGLEEPVVDDDCIICLAQVGGWCFKVCCGV